MAHILMLSSWVAHGAVGLCASAPAAQALGYTVTQLATTRLSNHPGWPHVHGEAVPVAELEAHCAALEANGWLDGVACCLTGYLPGADHVAFAARLIDRLRDGSGARVVVDPVLGDAPKGLYVPHAVAEALRADLLPRADVVTPNLFELGWLSGQEIAAGDMAGAQAAATALGVAEVHVTSAPARDADHVGLLHVTPEQSVWAQTPRRAGVPHGVGDAYAGMVAGGAVAGAALGHLSALVGESLGAPHLRVAETAALWRNAPALPLTRI